jgi:phosphate transport system substrate-binding protein
MKKSNLTLLSLLAVISMLLSACGTAAPAPTVAAAEPAKLSGTISASGAFALYPMMTRWAEEFQKLHPDVQFDVSGGGAGKGMTDALSGAVDIGMVSRKVKPEEEAKGAYSVGVVKDAVFPVVSAKNPVIADILARGITKETFAKIFLTGEIKTWGEVVGKPEIKDEIHVYTRSDAAGAADVWSQFMGGKAQADIKGVGVNADPGLLDAVIKDPLGIGYNNLGYAFDLSTGKLPTGAVVAPIDADGNGKADEVEVIDTLVKATDAVSSGKYPSPPARILNFVTKGKPSALVQAFIQWVLTDGQKFIPEAGFVALTPDQLAESLTKVK